MSAYSWQPNPMLPRALRNRIVIATLPGLLLGFAFIWRSSWISNGERRFTLFDDAMISMSYARTMADGCGLVWFPGAPRVEGITNPLWTFLMADVHRVGLEGSNASLVMMIIGLACIFGSAVLSASITARLSPENQFAPVITAIAVSCCYPLIFWTLRGMEVGFLSLIGLALVLTTIDVAQGPSRKGLLTASLLIMIGLSTRIDFAVLVVVCLVWLFFSSARRSHVVLPLALTTLGSLAVATIARLMYYGELLPNTYTLKMTGASLIERLQRGIITDLKLLPIVVLAAVALAIIWSHLDSAQKRIAQLLAAIGISTLLYSTYVGGDAWEAIPNRYVVPLVLASIMVSSVALKTIIDRLEGATRTQVTIAAALVALSGSALFFSGVSFEGTGALSEYETSRWLKWGLLASCVLVLVFILRNRIRFSRLRVIGLTTCGLSLILLGSSFVGGRIWQEGEPFTAIDQRQTEAGLWLGELTQPPATIAVSWAGAPIYYSNRAGIDILGKNDKKIAGIPAKGFFYPGHNKWDYTYSIVKQKPDVISDFVSDIRTSIRKAAPAELRYLQSNYTAYCLPTINAPTKIYIRKDSRLVNRRALPDLTCGKNTTK